jgi:predicted dehydrogenase
MTKPLIVGVAGYGYWGPNLVRNFKSLPNCRVAAVCDSSQARLKHLQTVYPDVTGESDFERFLADYELDAVVIATPVRHHYAMAKASLLAGKHTFIEKPMASSTAECDELVELAEEKGLILMVGHTFLYSSAVKKIAEIVRNGDIGDIRYINCRRLNLGLFQRTSMSHGTSLLTISPSSSISWETSPLR